MASLLTRTVGRLLPRLERRLVFTSESYCSSQSVAEREGDKAEENWSVRRTAPGVTEWKNPHIEKLLTLPDSLENTCSNEMGGANDLNSQNFVDYFTQVSLTSYRDESAKPQQLSRVRQLFATEAKHLTLEQLTQSLAALNCWPEAARSRSSLLLVPTNLEKDIREIYSILQEESVRRLWKVLCGEERFLSISYSKLGTIFDLCDLWLSLDHINRYKSRSFPVIAINKIADIKYSSSRFKRFDKDTFVRFLGLVGQCPIAEDFHKYYCTVKLIDLFPTMDQNDLSIACRTFIHHKIVWDENHPMEVLLRSLLLDFMMENRFNLSSLNLGPIAKFTGINFPLSLCSTAIKLQDTLVSDGLVPVLEPGALVHVANLATRHNVLTRQGVSHKFFDAMVDRFVEEPSLACSHLSLSLRADLAMMAALHRDTPPVRRLLAIFTQDLKERRELRTCVPRHGLKYLLGLAHLAIYDTEAIADLMDNPEVTKEAGVKGKKRKQIENKDSDDYLSISSCGDGECNEEETEMSDFLRYSSKGNKFAGGHLVTLQGMIELECPSYNGRKVIRHLEAVTRNWAHSSTPTVAPKEQQDRLWVKNGLKVFTNLESLVGKGKVLETYVLPFTGQVSYVILFDRESGRPIHPPPSFLAQPEFSVKTVDASAGFWTMLTPLHSARAIQGKLRTGGPVVLSRLASVLGYSHTTINLEELLEQGEGEKELEYMRSRLLSACPRANLSLDRISTQPLSNIFVID